MVTKIINPPQHKLAIITGASRGIGKFFANYYSTQLNTNVIRISRSNSPNITKLDLLNKSQITFFLNNLELKEVSELIYIHAVGIDKFEPDGKPQLDSDFDGIDDEVYSSNVTAFLNLAEPLIEKLNKYKIKTTICNIGSLSDLYEVPYWQSFSKSKNIVRKYLKSMNFPWIKSVFLNISSTLDEEGRTYGRIHANTTYWQTAESLVEKAITAFNAMNSIDSHYTEFDFYNPNPNFTTDYFTNLPKLFETWQKDMGYSNKKVPSGIRI